MLWLGMAGYNVAMTRIQALGVLLAFLTIVCANARDSQQDTWSGVERIVAVGDVHGDYDALVTVLRSANLLDEKNNWSGGKTHLAQTGDVLDRGPDSRKAMDLLMRLEGQAEQAGGHVHALIGNHEAMNVYGDLRYVSAGEYAAFADPGSKPSGDHPAGYNEHRVAFSPKGTYGKWILSHNAAVKINDTLFMHGGISPKYVSTKISQINDRVRDDLKHPDNAQGGILTDPEGPLWYRGLAIEDESNLQSHLNKVMKNFGIERIVVSHTYANAAITPRFAGRVVMIDIGLSRVYDGISKVGCLVIEGPHAYVLHRGTKLELPKDSPKDLLQYLKTCAALDPPPSPLAKRIAELESKVGN